MSENLIKISYNSPATGGKKLNAYLPLRADSLARFREDIEEYLFQGKQPLNRDYRIYWIDADSDEIEVINQTDFQIFLAKSEKNHHLHVVAAASEKTSETKQAPTATPTEDDASNFVIHDGVECDSCGVQPMIGFRYKCVQCPNFDLCQKCEMGHKHADHLMVRMPTNNGPSVVEAWLSGPGAGSGHHHRRSSRRFRGQCPFAEAAANATASSAQATPAGASAPDATRESRRERRHGRRHGGILSQFVDMMMQLPESNVTPRPAATNEGEEDKKKEQATETNNMQSEKAQENEKTEAGVKSGTVPEPEVKTNAAKVDSAAEAPKEKSQPEPSSTSSTPTTPGINLETLAQVVHPEYMRAGIEILNNFSEMFAKMIDPSEAATFGCTETSMASSGSTASNKSEVRTETTNNVGSQGAPDVATSTAPVAPEAPAPTVTPAAKVIPVESVAAVAPIPTPTVRNVVNAEPEQRRRSESLDQDWQLIDNNASPVNNVSSSDVSINSNPTSVTTTDASVSPVRDFVQLGEMLRQHVNEEQQREQTTTHTQTSQVDTVSTSTSTTAVSTNSTSTSTAAAPVASEERRFIPVYHPDERINGAINAMMAMGFSNEGAWLTQLLESVEGNIPAALDVMHASQGGRN